MMFRCAPGTVMKNEGHSRCHKPIKFGDVYGNRFLVGGWFIKYGVFLGVLLELHSLFFGFPNFPTMLVKNCP